MRYYVEQDGAYWTVKDRETGLMLVRRESFTVASNICDRANNPKLDDNTESTEVARSIREWAEKGESKA